MKTTALKILAFIMAVVTLASACGIFAFAKELSLEQEQVWVETADLIVATARAEIGHFESDVNKFTTWYYGIETSASWCSIFVSWCADSGNAIGVAVPKEASCVSMMNWFRERGEYYPVGSGYVPQKGDIMFMNTATDGSEDATHVEIVTRSGFVMQSGKKHVRAIGGCTSDINYEGECYVTEKTRPFDMKNAVILGYAHPSYEESVSAKANLYAFLDDNMPAIFKYFIAKLKAISYRFQYTTSEALETV